MGFYEQKLLKGNDMRNYEQLCSLATSIYSKHYELKADSVGFTLLVDEEGVISQIDNMICGIIRDNKTLAENACLDYISSERLLEVLLSRTCETNAPVKTSYGEGMKQFTVGIGKDETATVSLHFEGVDALRRENWK